MRRVSPTLFHRDCDCTFTEYLTRRRLSKACDLLRYVGMNVSQVSLAAGYQGPSYFSRLFKRVMGGPSGKYRDSLEAADDLLGAPEGWAGAS